MLWFGFYAFDLSRNTNTWYHVAFVYDNSTQQQLIYLNGLLDGSRSARPLLVTTGAFSIDGATLIHTSSQSNGKTYRFFPYFFTNWAFIVKSIFVFGNVGFDLPIHGHILPIHSVKQMGVTCTSMERYSNKCKCCNWSSNRFICFSWSIADWYKQLFKGINRYGTVPWKYRWVSCIWN